MNQSLYISYIIICMIGIVCVYMREKMRNEDGASFVRYICTIHFMNVQVCILYIVYGRTALI